MAAQLGPAAPAAGAPETEALRRFRTFATSALIRGRPGAPALEGLRPNERRVGALIEAWRDAAAQLSGARRDQVRAALDPLVQHFRVSIRSSQGSRRKSGAPRATRRAVVAAIDRVADAFLAIDTESGKIADANPAAGSLLGVTRDALLGIDAMSFVPAQERASWWTELDALSEGDDCRHFAASLQDSSGSVVGVHASITRFSTRGRTLALVLARPS